MNSFFETLTRAKVAPRNLLRLLLLMATVLVPLSAHAATYVVTSTADTGGSTCGATCTLRQAIGASNANVNAGVNTISFASPTFDTPQIISLSDSGGELAVTGTVFITGRGARLLSVRRPATATKDFRVFNLANNIFVSLSGMTIAGGRLTAMDGQGAGILKGGGGGLRLDGVSVEGNSISVSRGAIGGGGLDTFAPTNIFNSTFSGNSVSSGNADGGGAIRVASGVTLDIVNSTFSGNSSSTFGGAIHSRGALNVNQTTFTLNAGIGGGIFLQSGTMSLNNSIVAGNGGGTGPDINGTINSGDYNLIGNPSGTIFSGSPTHNKTGVDPKLGALANNGGQTDTHAPAPDSPAVDAGKSSVSTDQRGKIRPADLPAVANAQGGNGSDIGSVEFDAAQSGADFVVNTTRDGDDGVCSLGDCTLREAINAANGDGDLSAITFDATVFAAKQTITLTLGSLPAFASDVTVSGPTARGAGVTIADDQDNNFMFTTNSGTVTLSALTVTNGYVGILTRGGVTTVQGCTITGHFLGVQLSDGDLTVLNCTLSGNTKAAIYNNSFNSNATVTSSTISGNQDGISNIHGTTTVSNSIVSGNTRDNTFDITDGGFNLIGVDAKLGPLADNGGPTQTFALLAGSPAINAGSNALIPADVVTDQRGPGFARIVGGTVDIGAFELDPPQSGPNFVVNQTDDHDDGTCGAGDCTLREAIGAANGNADASAITFDATVFAGKQTLTLTLGNLPPFTSDVTVSGPTTPGAGVTVKGTTPGSGAIFETDSGTVTLSALTVTNGFIAVNTRGGNTTVQNCTLNGNSSGVNSEIDGTKVQNCTVTGNSNKGISNFSNTLTVTSSTISGNRTDIFNNGGTTTVSNSIVTNGSSGINDGGFNLIGVDAKLGPLADNGGPTFTFALLAGSPAIDAGNSAFTTDQRGRVRPFDFPNVANAAGGNGSDIGAYELQDLPQSGPNFEVNQTDDHDDGTCGTTDCTLREAINAANGNGAGTDTITFDATVFASKQTIALSQGLLPLINTDILINGPTASGAGVTINADANNSIFDVIGGTSTFSNLTLSGGNINGDGGAIQQSGASILTLNNCTLSGNSASRRGGAIYTNAMLTLNSCTLSGNGNTVTGAGGGIYSSGTLTLNSCTLSGNRADNGGGLFIGMGAFNLSNTIVAGNTAPTNPDLSGTINAGDYNLIGNSQGAIFSGSASHNLTGVDPKLGPLADNGGPTFTFALQSGSPAIDAGNTPFTSDQRGRVRPFDFPNVANAAGGNGSDIGAFELNETPQSGANFVVNQTDDHDDGVCGPTDCTLREAINAANGNADASAITFDATVFAARQTLATQTEFPELTSDISISGPTAPGAGVTISQVNAGTGALVISGGTVNLTNLTFTSPNSYGVQNSGGDGNLTVRGCTFAGNFIGLTFNSGTTTVSNCTFSGNTQYGISATTNCSIDSSTLSGNKTGLYVDYLTATVSNTIIAGNTTNVETEPRYGTVNDAGHNILTGTAADAGLGALADNGGPTQTFALLAGSPAIDAGNSTLTTDQRGFKRPQGRAPDIGAFESSLVRNSAPVASPQSIAVTAGQTFNGQLTATDAEGDALTFAKASDAANGVVTVNADGSFSYTANAGFSGDDSFTFTANDGTATSAPATVSISVNAPNQPPTLNNMTYSAGRGQAFSAQLQGRDPNGDTLTYSTTDPLPPGLALSSSGLLSGTPTTTGSFRFTVTVDDGRGGTTTARILVVVTTRKDGLAPVLTRGEVPSPTTRDALAATTLSGTVRDIAPSGVTPAGVKNVLVQLRRNGETEAYNGKSFTSDTNKGYYPATLGAASPNTSAGTRTWSRNLSFVPSDLAPGDYTLIVLSQDKASNYNLEVVPFTVVAPSGPPAARAAAKSSGSTSLSGLTVPSGGGS